MWFSKVLDRVYTEKRRISRHVICRQMAPSVTASAAGYRASRSAISARDTINKWKVMQEETGETIYRRKTPDFRANMNFSSVVKELNALWAAVGSSIQGLKRESHVT